MKTCWVGPGYTRGMHALPLMLAALCTLAIAWRYYSAFLAAKVLALDETRVKIGRAHV